MSSGGGLVPLKTNATPTGTLFGAGGGGGGPIGPNPVVSSLTVNPNSAGILLPNNNVGGATIVGYQDQANVSTLQLCVSFVGNYQDKITNGDGLWTLVHVNQGGNYYADFGAGRFVVLGNNGGASIPPPVVDADTNGQMSINAVSTINISTPTLLLNGAPIGGGGGGTDITVSSITINSAGLDGQYFPYNATSTIGIGAGPSGNLMIGNQQGGVNPVLTSGAQINTGEIILSGLTGDFGSQIQARVGADGQGNVQISSLYVSSINNAAPGGGGGPNPQVSTLSVNDTGNITLDWNNGGGTLNFGFEATNTSSFILQQGIGVVGTKVAGPEGCLQALEKDGGANQVFAPLQASGFEVCATAYPGGAFAGLYFSSIGSVLYSAVGQPLTIDAPAGVSVSSLSVSSINGAVPGGGSSYPKTSTIGLVTGGAYTNLSTNNGFICTDPIAVQTGHLYMFSVRGSPNSAINSYSSFTNYQFTGNLLTGQAFTPNVVGQPQTCVFTAFDQIGAGSVTLEVVTEDIVPYDGAINDVKMTDLGPIGNTL